MWIIAGHLRVPHGDVSRYVSEHLDLVRRAREAPGCLDVAITADPVDAGRINNFERWESWADIEAWREVAHAPELDVEISDVSVRAYEVASERAPF